MNTNGPVTTASGKRRAVLGAGALLGLGLLVGAGYLLSREHGATKGAAPDEHGQTDGVDSKPDTGNDRSAQIVRLSPEAVRKYGVRIGTARKRKLVSEIEAPARVAFNGEATAVIATPVQGRVVEIKARVGDRVEQGSALLEIESTELGEAQSDYMQRQTAANTAQAAIQPLTEIYTRIKKLSDESRLIGITEVQEREMDLRKAEGAVATTQAAVTAAKNKLHLLGMDEQAIGELSKYGKINPRYTVRAPLSGEVIERLVNLGELVKPEREKLLVVADTSTLWVWADVPESRAREIKLGATCRVSTSQGSGQAVTGVVSHIASSIDPETRSLRVRVEVKHDPALIPGMFAQVEISGRTDGDSGEPVLAVPESALQTVAGGAAAFIPVEGEGNAFKVRMVGIGVNVDGLVSIVSGLDEGERIVTAGTAILKADLLKATAKDED